jgi:putative ABC transport system permease protein
MAAEVPIARRNLLADKVKFLIALSGVTLAIVLILVIQSVFQGVKRDSESFIRSLPGDVWVTQRGASGLTLSNSFLTDRNAAEVATVPGVTAVHRLYGRLTSFEADGDETQVYAWALAPGGALSTEDSRFLPEPDTIFIDRALAKKAGVSRGDVLRYDGSEFTVAEVEQIGNLIIAQFAFIHPEDYSRLFGRLGAANFFLVSLSADATDDTMEEIARRVEGTSVFTTDEFVEVADQANLDFLIIIRVVMVISFIVGLALLSSTIYSATIERAREYGIMKVLGASPWRLYRIVLSQSASIALLGFGAGVGLAFLFNRVAGDLVPEFVTYVRWQDVALTLGLAAFMTFVASFLPISRIARVDPASVFRA